NQFGYLVTGTNTASQTASITNGSAVVTLGSTTSGLVVGETISGTGIQAGTTIIQVLDGTHVAISAPATSTGTPTVQFGGVNYTPPEGKGFVIGSLGSGSQVSGVLGVGVTGGTGSNTANLVGSPKLAGYTYGDVNIHANAVSDNQSLTLLARNAGDTLN